MIPNFRSPNPVPRTQNHGFTLVEMAMVLVIIGLIILTIFPALNIIRTSSQRSLTQSNVQALLLATASYVQANGCLPCPAPAGVSTTGFGRVRGDTSASPAPCGTCAIPEGIPPFMSLGIPQGTAHDGWGYWITMRVDPALTVNFNVVPPTAACQASDLSPTVTPTCVTLNASQKGLCRSGLSTSNRISVQTPFGSTQQAAVIFVSHGSHGFGSFVASALPSANNGFRLPFSSSAPGCSASGGYAQCNADGNIQFVNAPSVPTGNDPYDDVLAFADRNTLVSMLGNGSCQTVW